MKQAIFLIFFIMHVLHLFSQPYDHSKVKLLGHWDKPGNRYSSCWGYEQNDRQYAIVGRGDGTYIVDITDPENMILRDSVLSPIEEAIWREYKTYGNYLYAVSDDFGPNVMQIIDLSYLPDSVHVAYEGQDLLVRGHTIFIDNDKLYIGIRRGLVQGNAMTVFDLKPDPVHPVEIRSLDEDYPNVPDIHDMFVRNDTVYASGGNGGMHFFVLENDHFRKIGEYTNYPFSGYNHSSSLSPDGKKLIFTDEVPENLPAKMLDITDFNNPQLLDTFYTQSGRATVHNPFMIDSKYFVMASYMDGVQIFDYSDPKAVKLAGYFDTYPQADGPSTSGDYAGAWSAYPWLSNGRMITVDMANGLFVLDPSEAMKPTSSVKERIAEHAYLTVSPNPTNGRLSISVPEGLRGASEISIFQSDGKLVKKLDMEIKDAEVKLDIPGLSGIYNLVIRQDNKIGFSSFIKVN